MDGREHGSGAPAATSGQPSGQSPATARRVVLGQSLHRIVLGRGALGNAPARLVGGEPELVFSVHGATGEPLGYAVVDRTLGRAGSWGGLTINPGEQLESVIAQALTTALEIRLFGLKRGSHHCALIAADGLGKRTGAARRREFLDALRPLIDAGICHIVYTRNGNDVEPQLPRQGLIASIAATTLATLEHLQIDRSRASVAVYRPERWAEDAVGRLAEFGLRPLATDSVALATPADVLLLGPSTGSLGLEESNAVRASVLVPLGRLTVTRAAVRRLHERGVVLIPEALAAGGLLVGTDLRARGLDERSALHRTFSTVQDRTRALLGEATRSREPLSDVLRAWLERPTEGRPTTVG